MAVAVLSSCAITSYGGCTSLLAVLVVIVVEIVVSE